MIRRIIDRPVAVTMTVIAVLIVGIISIGRIPVSLMPDIDIPEISIRFAAPGMSAREIDNSVIQPLRQQLIQIPSLDDLVCESGFGSGAIKLSFEPGSDIDLCFIEVNEKVDRAMTSLPKEVERPKIVEASAVDIPAFFIDVTPGKDVSEHKFMELSRFALQVISKRVEQLESVALVDISGTSSAQIVIYPDYAKLTSLEISPESLEQSINRNNVSLGNLTIKDGYYQWLVKFNSEIRDVGDIEEIFLDVDGKIFKFKDLADVRQEICEPSGKVLSDSGRTITMAVIKQSDAKMSALRKDLHNLLDEFSTEYPDLSFDVTRDQTELLDYSINNLKWNIILGALLAVLILFFFMKDFGSPLLVALTIPLSLVISMLALYLLHISINIISLSGLILGVGMMVDNSIVIIDNISQYRERGMQLKSAAAQATRDVIAPLFSSVLTTCSVFIPLIFLSGTAGALFYDQAMAITASLFSSLLVSVIVIPVYYCLLYRKENDARENKFLARLQFIDYERAYENAITWVFRHQKLTWGIFGLMVFGTVALFIILDKSKLPPISYDDVMVEVNWNEPVTIEENGVRAMNLLSGLDGIVNYDVMVGRQDFILTHTKDMESNEALFYIKASSVRERRKVEKDMESRLRSMYPDAGCSFSQATNIFNMMFSEDQADIVAMIQDDDGGSPDPDEINNIARQLQEILPDVSLDPVIWQDMIQLTADSQMMTYYGISYQDIFNVISVATKKSVVMSISNGSFVVPVVMSDRDQLHDLLSLHVSNSENVSVPLSSLVTESKILDLKSIVSGKQGGYFPLNINLPKGRRASEIVQAVNTVIKANDGYSVSFSGSYYASRALIRELLFVLLVSVLLLYFILAAQFESFMQPLIILSELVVDIFGALLSLWIAGAGINLMSMIGIVVMCGIVINDSILKVDTINHLRKEYPLLRAILLSGVRRLKPIVMTSLTTILAVVPFLTRGGMGSDLQFPLSVALIGGMIVGTAVSLFFVPVCYYEFYKNHR